MAGKKTKQKEQTYLKSEPVDNLDIVRFLIKQSDRYELISDKEEFDRLYRLQKSTGSDIEKSRLICPNIRFITGYAASVKNRYNLKHLKIEDLVQEGILGLLKAYDKYDPEAKGSNGEKVKFLSYAGHWIKQSIARAIYNKDRAIRLSIDRQRKIGRIFSSESELEEKLKRKPTKNELAEKIGVDITYISKIYNDGMHTISLDTPLGDDYDSESIIDYVESHYEDPTENVHINSPVEYIIKNADLNERDKDIMRLRLFQDYTLEEIGINYGLTRERIRQIEQRAFSKIKQFIEQKEKDDSIHELLKKYMPK
ncbi:MAG: sigma-70 family RNA polymerase sigma factor [Candidatus Woesearchaeota archaeon]